LSVGGAMAMDFPLAGFEKMAQTQNQNAQEKDCIDFSIHTFFLSVAFECYVNEYFLVCLIY
jgi:hypothetical protein